MDKDLFFEKLFINSELADNICLQLNINRKQYSEIATGLEIERKTEILVIKRIRSLYNNKKNLDGFEFKNFNSFYKWYIAQYAKQEAKCYYCQTDEFVIATLFEKKFTKIRRTNRGKHLEVERLNSSFKNNFYNDANCVLACYFCNNDKSDIFDELEYLEYLKDRKVFFIKEYNKLNDNR